mmetsp:Transcript_23370/g.58021  ORF Transcript_23370/g.58021 Transcript_23370/m.58021 type:complete len:629 (+) Transcript_23370:86-1972(+)
MFAGGRADDARFTLPTSPGHACPPSAFDQTPAHHRLGSPKLQSAAPRAEWQRATSAARKGGSLEEGCIEGNSVPIPPLLSVSGSAYSSDAVSPPAAAPQSGAIAALLHATSSGQPADPSRTTSRSATTTTSSNGMRENASGVPVTTDVSTEWHVHLVRQAESPTKRRDPLSEKAQLCVQCPNGRKHSSLFAVHLYPHWLPSNQPRVGMEPQHVPVAASNIKAASSQGMHEWMEADQQQRARLSASMSDWLTGKEYPNAIIFCAHPNGHLVDDKQMAILTMPTSGCMKALLKIRRPLDPNAPSEQLQLHRLSTLKITLHVEFTSGSASWTKDFVSPGVIKLVSRVNEHRLSAEELQNMESRKRKDAPANDADLNAASILVGRHVGVADSSRRQAEPIVVPARARDLQQEAQAHVGLFYRSYMLNPELTLDALSTIINEGPLPTASTAHMSGGDAALVASAKSIGAPLLNLDGSCAPRVAATPIGAATRMEWGSQAWDHSQQEVWRREQRTMATKKKGFTTLWDLRDNGCPLSDVRIAGYTLLAAKKLGYSLEGAKEAGYTMKDAKDAGFALKDAIVAGFPMSEAQQAGYSMEEVQDTRASGLFCQMMSLGSRGSGELSDSQLFDLVADA